MAKVGSRGGASALLLGLLGVAAGVLCAAVGGGVAAASNASTTTSAPTSTSPTSSPGTTGSPTATTSTTSPLFAPLGPTTTNPSGQVSTTTTSASTTTTSTTATTVPPAGDYTFNPLSGVIPPDAQAEIAAFHPTPPGSTKDLVAALQPLQGLGFTAGQAAILGFGRFPVAGPAIWSDDFLSPRFGADGSFRFHHATDIPAACGLPIRAPDEGTFREGSDPGGGTTAEITEPDGTYVFLAHLSGYAAGVTDGQHVRIGDVIGTVGETGIATGCHVHIEIHPGGGAAVDPKPFLDAWVADALANAPLLVDEVRADRGLPNLSPAGFFGLPF